MALNNVDVLPCQSGFAHADSTGWTGMHSACARGDAKKVRLLLARGENPLKRSVGSKWCAGLSPLEIAAQNGFVDIVSIFDSSSLSEFMGFFAEDLMMSAARGGNGMVEVVGSLGDGWFGVGDDALRVSFFRGMSVSEANFFISKGFPRTKAVESMLVMSSLTNENLISFLRASSQSVKNECLFRCMDDGNVLSSVLLMSFGATPFADLDALGRAADEFPKMLSDVEAVLLSKGDSVPFLPRAVAL